MDTLYTLCRSADDRHTYPLSAADVRDIVACKRTFFQTEAENNPLVREILSGGRISFPGLEAADRHRILSGPATFFRAHEILRKSRGGDLPIRFGEEELPHQEAVALLGRCIPNVKLQHLPWCSLSSYRMSLALAWGSTLLVSLLMARGVEGAGLFDTGVLYYMGIATTLAAVIYSVLRQNRDVRLPAPWNSCLYLDLNVDLLRRDQSTVAVARKGFLPRQTPWKTHGFYYTLAQRIAAHDYDAELAAKLAEATAPGTRKRSPEDPPASAGPSSEEPAGVHT